MLVASAADVRAEFIATATDPAADAADPHPGRDITAIAMVYDRKKGSLSGFVRFRGSPEDAPSFITLFAGMRSATGCDGYPAGGFGSYTDEFGASWTRLDSPGSSPTARGEADTRGFDSEVQTFEVTDAALADRPWDCAIATITEPSNAANVYDTTGPIALVGQPGLAVNVRAPDEFRPNRRASLKITLSNPGDGPAKQVRLRLGRSRGLSLTPRTKKLGTLAPGQRKTYRVKARFTTRANEITELPLKASAGKLVAEGTLRLRVRLPDRPAGGGGSGGSDAPDVPRLCTRYSPATTLSIDTGGADPGALREIADPLGPGNGGMWVKIDVALNAVPSTVDPDKGCTDIWGEDEGSCRGRLTSKLPGTNADHGGVTWVESDQLDHTLYAGPADAPTGKLVGWTPDRRFNAWTITRGFLRSPDNVVVSGTDPAWTDAPGGPLDLSVQWDSGNEGYLIGAYGYVWQWR